MKTIWPILIAFVCGLLATVPAFGQVARDELPEVAQGVSVDQKLGAELPLDLRFHDEDNNYVRFGDYFNKKKPVLLSFNYSNCPKLCSVQLQNLAMALQDIRLKPGRDFELVIVSIDPNEQSAMARELKKKYLALYGELDTEEGWHILTGEEDSIKFLTGSCGFNYKYIPRQKIYSHPSAFIFCSPKGKVVRYLDGLDKDLRFKIDKALMEAGEGKTGTLLDKVLYFSGCYVFDEHQGRYSLAMMNIMRWGGGVTVALLLIWLVPIWLMSIFRSSKKQAPEDNDTSNKTDGLLASN